MAYFVIENFGHGLDARRHILNLPPGALYRAKNCNINRGGEPEAAKAFVPKINLPIGAGGPGSADVTFGLLSAGGKLWTFGSYAFGAVPDGITYQRLLHPSGGYMTGVIHATPIKGKPFVIASFIGGYGVFFNGTIIADWLPLALTTGSYTDVAAGMAAAINASALYTATAAGNVVTVTGRPGVAYAASATATNGGGVNDQTAAVAVTQAAVPVGTDTASSCTVTISGVTGNYDFDSGRTFDELVVQGITINGVEVLHTPIYAQDDLTAAYGIRNYINTYSSSPDYTATLSGNVVTISALPGTGAGPNAFPVVLNSAPKCTASAMGGGSTAAPAVPQKVTVTFGGTYEAADTYSITLGGEVFTLSSGAASANPAAGQRPTMALTKNSKTYAIAGPNLFGSKIGDCTEWDSGTGTFVTDMSSEVAGAEILTALGLFQGNLAIFSRSTIQIRFVDPDPANNEQLQVLQSIGTMAPKSVISFGDSDLFFLADTGLRSLKVRTSTDSATLSDIGSAVDPLVIAAIKAQGVNIGLACASMEPVDGRFLLQIGTTTYVFNFFPDAKVAAWTTYESGLAITDFAVLEQRLFARAGNTVYLLGGENNDTYSPQPMDIKLPFLNARQLATLKHFTALDVACDGVFDVFIATDPAQPDAEEGIATLNGSTAAMGIAPFSGEDVTAIALRFVGRPSKYARLSSIALHYDPIGETAL